MNKRYAIAGLLAFSVGAFALAGINPFAFVSRMSHGALHVWGSDEVVTNTDLNANFSELNTTKVGGGVTASNADIASNAAIAHSKLATPALVPKAWAYVGSAACAASPCTLADSSRVTSIARTGAGVYTVTLAYTPANANFAVNVTSNTASLYCAADGLATAAPQITLRCYDAAAAATDAAYSFTVMDS